MVSDMNRSSRKSAFLTRKTTLVNKLKELTILCDIEAGMIFLDPYKSEPEIFARNPGEFIRGCRNLSETEKWTETETMFDVLNARKKKIESELADLRRKICYEEIYPSWDLDLESFTEDQLIEVLGSLDATIEIVNEKMEVVSKGKKVVVVPEPIEEYLCLPPPEDFRPMDEPEMVINHPNLIPDEPNQGSDETYYILASQQQWENSRKLGVYPKIRNYVHVPEKHGHITNWCQQNHEDYEPDLPIQADDFWELDKYINQSTSNGPDYVPCETLDQDTLWDIVEGKQQNSSLSAQSGITREETLDASNDFDPTLLYLQMETMFD